MTASVTKINTDVSDDISSFEELGGIFLEREINGQVNKIDIEKY